MPSAHAQFNDYRVYDSLTEVAGSQTGTQNVTGNTAFVSGIGLARNKGASAATGAAAHSARFGGDIASSPVVADLGNGTLSTSIVIDDVGLKIDTSTGIKSTPFSAFKLTGMRFLLTNENSTSIIVTPHLRIYNEDGVQGGNGGFPGTLLGSYDLANVTLDGKGSDYASVKQVDVPGSAFTSTPITIAGSQFGTTGFDADSTTVSKRIWVGLFLTASSANTTTTELGNVGTVNYDTDMALDGTKIYFDRDGHTGRGGSDDQFYGDNITDPSLSNEGPRANGSYNQANAQDIIGSGIFTVHDLDITVRPDAALSYFINGSVVIFPEPGTFGLLAVGAIPVLGLVRRRLKK